MISMKCICEYCQRVSDKEYEYHIDIDSFSRKLPRGVSGILRVKNDAEFLAESVDSCIGALDELIIVYNGCTDESPGIIREKAVQYGDKIKCYEYTPVVYANNLTDEEYNFVKQLPENSPHLLANYCNYALTKVSYEFVVKIDADQIYNTEEFRKLCDAYRCENKVRIYPWEFICALCFYIGLILFKKLSLPILPAKKYLAQKYRKCLFKFISRYKVPVFLSGVNTFYHDGQWYVTLGQKNEEGLNILPPYNGVGDTIVFRLTPDTYFIPWEMHAYSKLNGHCRSMIEILKGVEFSFPLGFIWMHLNCMRRSIYEKQAGNLLKYSDRFMAINTFVSTPLKKTDCTKDSDILSAQNRHLFSLLHDTYMNQDFMTFVMKYTLEMKKNFVLKKI